MKPKITTLLFCFTLSSIFIFIFNSCSQLKLSNSLKGKYRYEDSANNSILEVNVGIIPIIPTITQEEKNKTFWDLRDSLPHLYLRLLSEKTGNADTLIKLISKPLYVPNKNQPKTQTDFQDIKVRFIFSNIKKYYEHKDYMHPNTRLEFLNTSLKIKDAPDVYFYSIDKLENEFEEIDLGTVERTQNVNFGVNLSAESALGVSTNNKQSNNNTSNNNLSSSINNENSGSETSYSNNHGNSREHTISGEAKTGYKADASYANNEIIKEAMSLKPKKMKTGFSFSSRKITISQRGRPLSDISDNVFVTATLRIKNNPEKNTTDSRSVSVFSNLYNAENTQTISEKLNVKQIFMTYISCSESDEIHFETSYSGAIRVVDNRFGHNSRSSLEFDDKVTFEKISGNTTEELVVNKNLFCKDAYRVTAKKKGSNEPYTLQIKYERDEELNLFGDHSPEIFYHWLIEALDKPTSKLLKTEKSKLKLYFKDAEGDTVSIVGNDMDQQQKLEDLKNIDIKSIRLIKITNEN